MRTRIFSCGQDPRKALRRDILKAGMRCRAARATYAARRALEQGFVALRDLETEARGTGHRDQAGDRRGTIPGPRIFGATRAISTTGGYNWKDMRRNWRCPRARSLWTGRWKRRRRRAATGARRDWNQLYMTHRSWVDKQGNLVSQPTLTVESEKPSWMRRHGWQKKSRATIQRIGMQRALDGDRFDRARGRDYVAQIAPDATAGDVYLPDDYGVITAEWAPAALRKERDRARAAVALKPLSRRRCRHIEIVFGRTWRDPWTDPIAQEFRRRFPWGWRRWTRFKRRPRERLRCWR